MRQEKSHRKKLGLVLIVTCTFLLTLLLAACPEEGASTPAPPGTRDIIIDPSFTPSETQSPITSPETTAPSTVTPPKDGTTPSPFVFPPAAAPPLLNLIRTEIAMRGVIIPPTVIVPPPLPSPLEALSGVDITINVGISNFEIVDRRGQSNAPGEGHLLYFIDVDPPIIPGQPAVTAEGTYVSGTNTRFTWTDVTPGIHIFSVELVNNDDTPLQPPVVASIKVRVPQPIDVTAPVIQSVTLRITPPTTPSPIPSPASGTGMDVNISTMISNFNLTAASVPAFTPGQNQGHILYSMDISTAAPGTSPSLAIIPSATVPSPDSSERVQQSISPAFTWPNVIPGPHTFRIELVNRDNTPLNPQVYYEFAVIIPAITSPG